MPPTKNQIAATLTRGEAAQAGILSAGQATEVITSNAKRLFGFTRKMKPQGLPTEPKLYIFSVSEYGDMADLGPGFPKFTVHACPPGQEYGEPCIVDPIYFFEEAKVDVTEHTFTSGQQIADAIMKIGPGMNASWDRHRVGWLVSESNPPAEEEVQHALQVYTQECQRLLQEGNRHAAANHLNEINETHRRSASFLKQKVDWDRPLQKMVDCVGCKEPIRSGAIMHAVPYCGAVQPGRWPDAILNGMKKLEDAPADVQEALTKPAKSVAPAINPSVQSVK